ncbi:MAG: hypothetical protein RBU21_19495 [FCB group bacterium]|nr:hypothetical protein [FCB group bacterium]
MARREKSATVRLNPDERFFIDHEAELMKAYEGRFVAIRHCEVAADAATRRELEEILVRKYGAPAYAMVRRVAKSAFDLSPAGAILIS